MSVLRGGKVVLALVSVLVLLSTGYGWATFNELQEGLTTTDVIRGFNSPDGATDILLVGNDSRTDAQGNPLPEEVLSQLRAADNDGELTDTMILVRIPNDGRSAVGISFPRDTLVEMPHGFGEHKLNSAFARGKNARQAELVEQGADPQTVFHESHAAGRRLLIESIENLTGVGIDHYAEVNLLGFFRLTQAVGGVEVCLNQPVQEEYSGINLPAGPQRIQGGDALAFVRQRYGLPRGDLDRIRRQQVFLASLARQILSSGTLSNPSRVRQLVEATQQTLVLDDGWNVLDFAQRMQGITAGQIRFVTIPVVGNGYTDDGGAALVVDPEQVQQFVTEVSGTAPPPPSSSAEANPQITVDVFNSTGITGLAGRVSDELAAQGFGIGTVGNAEPLETTVIRHAPGEEANADAVAEALGQGVPEESADIAPGTVSVVLGSDYTGPGANNFAGGRSFDFHNGPPEAPRAAPDNGQAPPSREPIVAGDVPCVN